MSSEIINKITEFFKLDVISDQYFDWGEQHWLQLEPDDSKLSPTVSVAVVYPGKEELPHIHSGYAEIVIGLDGRSTHWCNTRVIELEKGKIGYISEASQHRLVNNTTEIASFLSIVYSVIPKSLKKVDVYGDIELAEVARSMNLDAIAEKFAQTVSMPVTLIDSAGSFLTDKSSLPEICRVCIHEQSGNCILNTAVQEQVCDDLKIFHCKFGVSAIQSPIIINNKVLGYLGCGYGRMSTNFPAFVNKQKDYLKLRFINRNQLTSVAETLSLVSASLVQLMINSMKEKELSNYRVSLYEEREMQARLYNSLSQARLKFLESQVNPHFLFNTLNTIAQQSEMDGSSTAASLTCSLSNLLRLSLGKAESLVTIKEELSYVKDYLFIQKTRFPNKFNVVVDMDHDIFRVKIPFMTIMVLVENSVLHGFRDVCQGGKLLISGYKKGTFAVVEVRDNGSGIPDDVAAGICETSNIDYDLPKSLKGLGIPNIFLRLKHYYGERFELTIKQPDEGGTLARIVLPL